MCLDFIGISRAVSHALRHEPWLYELELDGEGWTSVQSLLCALRSQVTEWSNLQVIDLEEMIRSSSKKRHELKGDQIRAFYGHSVPGKLRKTPALPPVVLYHGTSPDLVDIILDEGLKPMGRQYVHLSVDQAIAREVGKRKSSEPVILVIHAAQANQEGCMFYEGNDKVWLADYVPASAITAPRGAEGGGQGAEGAGGRRVRSEH